MASAIRWAQWWLIRHVVRETSQQYRGQLDPHDMGVWPTEMKWLLVHGAVNIPLHASAVAGDCWSQRHWQLRIIMTPSAWAQALPIPNFFFFASKRIRTPIIRQNCLEDHHTYIATACNPAEYVPHVGSDHSAALRSLPSDTVGLRWDLHLAADAHVFAAEILLLLPWCWWNSHKFPWGFPRKTIRALKKKGCAASSCAIKPGFIR